MRRVGEWIQFGDGRYVRKLTVYDEMQWEGLVELAASTHAAAAPLGGPVASYNPENDPTAIVVCNAGGVHLYDAVLPSDARDIVAVGWSQEEVLVVLTAAYHCLLWENSRRTFYRVKAAPASISTGNPPILARVASSAAVFVSGPSSVHVVRFEEKRDPTACTYDLPLPANAEVTALTVVPGYFMEDDDPALLIAASRPKPTASRKGQGGATHALLALRLTTEDVVEVSTALPSPCVQLAVSPRGTHVALAFTNGTIAVCTVDFQHTIKTLDLGIRQGPFGMHWVGSDYLHLQFNVSQFSEDPYEQGHMSLFLAALERCERREVVRWDLEGSGSVLCTPEVDGLRVISDRANYFFQIVPSSLAEIFALGSRAAAANLVRATLEVRNGESIDGITALRALCTSGGVQDALDAIVEAASAEFTVAAQERLLAAVAVAKSQPGVVYDSDVFVDVCRRIQLLNSIRDQDGCAIPISHVQYSSLSGSTELRLIQPREAQVLVDRLALRGDYRWAVDVASFFGMKIDKVMVHWSVAKVMHASDDEAAHASILKALDGCPGTSLTEAALEAAASGKQRLAVRLLDSEPKYHNQVTLLLDMGLDEIAMEKAVASGSADLTYLVLQKIQQQMPEPTFESVLTRYPAARMQFLAAAVHSPSLMQQAESYLLHAGSERHVAAMKLTAAFQPRSRVPVKATRKRVSKEENPDHEVHEEQDDDEDDDADDDDDPLRRIQGTKRLTVRQCSHIADLLVRGGEPFAEDAKACMQHRELLELQEKLMDETGDSSVRNMSITETIRYTLANGMPAHADAIRVKFRVPDRMFWYTKLIALAEEGQWDDIERMGGVGRHKAPKSPIGYRAFVEVLYQHNQPERAVPYVARLPSLVQRVEWYVKLDEFQRAVDDAFEAKSAGLLQQIKQRSQNPSIQDYIAQRLKALE